MIFDLDIYYMCCFCLGFRCKLQNETRKAIIFTLQPEQNAQGQTHRFLEQVGNMQIYIIRVNVLDC